MDTKNWNPWLCCPHYQFLFPSRSCLAKTLSGTPQCYLPLPAHQGNLRTCCPPGKTSSHLEEAIFCGQNIGASAYVSPREGVTSTPLSYHAPLQLTKPPISSQCSYTWPEGQLPILKNLSGRPQPPKAVEPKEQVRQDSSPAPPSGQKQPPQGQGLTCLRKLKPFDIHSSSQPSYGIPATHPDLALDPDSAGCPGPRGCRSLPFLGRGWGLHWRHCALLCLQGL